jgi:hypothetical protein
MNKKPIIGINSDENIQKNCCKGSKNSASLFLLLLTISLVTVSPTAFADEDEDREDDNNEGLALGGGIPNAIFYGTIVVIVGSVAYIGFKIFKIKRPKMS